MADANLLNFIIFLLSTIGATLIITQSYIFKGVRDKISSINNNLSKLIKCPQCTGFYVSIIVQFIILLKIRGEFLFFFSDLYYLLYGFIGSFVCYITYLLMKPLIDKYD